MLLVCRNRIYAINMVLLCIASLLHSAEGRRKHQTLMDRSDGALMNFGILQPKQKSNEQDFMLEVVVKKERKFGSDTHSVCSGIVITAVIIMFPNNCTISKNDRDVRWIGVYKRQRKQLTLLVLRGVESEVTTDLFLYRLQLPIIKDKDKMSALLPPATFEQRASKKCHMLVPRQGVHLKYKRVPMTLNSANCSDADAICATPAGVTLDECPHYRGLPLVCGSVVYGLMVNKNIGNVAAKDNVSCTKTQQTQLMFVRLKPYIPKIREIIGAKVFGECKKDHHQRLKPQKPKNSDQWNPKN